VRIHPESQRRRYLEWLREIRPWCISRQLWWGHRIPVWYRGEERFAGVEPPPGEGWVQDEDVLDTWFSSALWPFATLGWPDDTPQLRAFYPTAVLSTARDILFLWVARMVMLGLEFAGDVPFRDVYVHSVIQAPDGRRMSKSLGTGIDPLEVIEQHGADGTRFGLLAMSSTQDVRFSEEKIAQGAALANKLFNATRFVLGRVQDVPAEPRPRTVEDRWVLSRLARTVAETRARFEAFDFAKAALGLYDFVYGELCDWYLELIKGREFDEDLSATLRWVLRETLALTHPVIPFVTEELWEHVGGDGLLAAASYPQAGEVDEDAEHIVAAVVGAVTAVRSWRNAAQVKPGAVLPARAASPEITEEGRSLVARLARLEWGEGDTATSIPVPGGAVDLLPTGDVDFAAVAARREAERKRLRGDVARTEAKLANERFTSRAPAHVVDGERAKLDRLRAELEALG
jgi:valyl-tRNA synthetase